MALRFRNLSGNPYAGLASTAESVYGRLGSTTSDKPKMSAEEETDVLVQSDASVYS